MRTDCEIDTEAEMDLPEIHYGAGIRTKVKRGDLVYWNDGSDPTDHVGRVIGFVTAHDIEGPQLCVAMFFGNTCCERWVELKHVWRCEDLDNVRSSLKLMWLFGPEFPHTPPDVARNCYDKLAVDMMQKDDLLVGLLKSAQEYRETLRIQGVVKGVPWKMEVRELDLLIQRATEEIAKR